MNQNQQSNMTPDQAAAALSFATHLSQQMMPKMPQQPQEAPQTPENAPESTQMSQEPQDTVMENYEARMSNLEDQVKELTSPKKELKEEKDLGKEFDGFKDEMKKMINSKFDDLSNSIKDALK